MFDQCDLIITSGGMGPTQDDITKDSIAKYLGRKISYSEASEKIAVHNYSKYDRPFPGKDHGYCFLPDGFLPLNNSTGFAPGLFTEEKGKFLLCAPGVPREFNSMLADHLPSLVFSKNKNVTFIDHVIARTRRVPEEKIFSEIDKTLWDKLSVYGDVSSLPIILGVDIGVKIRGATEAELDQKKKAVKAIFDSSPVKDIIWHFGSESLEQLIIDKANRKNIKFGFAESCTGGLCSHRVTQISGSSSSFMGSVISYDEVVKLEQLNVSEKTLSTNGVVSVAVAEEMAKGLVKALHLDIGISTTGFAGPTGGTNDKPVGTVCIGVATERNTTAIQYRFFGDREQLKNRFAQAALLLLLEEVEKFAGSDS